MSVVKANYDAFPLLMDKEPKMALPPRTIRPSEKMRRHVFMGIGNLTTLYFR